MLIFGAVTKSYITRMFKSNSGEPYAGKLHVRFLEEFISNCLIIREGENLLMQIVLVLLVAFVAGIEGILDEFEFHQPIVACTLIGLVTNHLNEGLLLGGSLQLIALGWANIGAAVAPDVCLASVISSILMVHGLNSTIEARFVIAFSIALAIPLSLVGLSLTKVCRNLAIQLVHKIVSYQIE